MTELQIAWTCCGISFAALLGVSLLLVAFRLHCQEIEADLEAAEARADFASQGGDSYARCRELTAENAGLRCELTETHDQLEEAQTENKRLRLELWQEKKRIRDVRKVLDAPASAELVGTTDRAG